jgi:cytoskeletal protein RodZ
METSRSKLIAYVSVAIISGVLVGRYVIKPRTEVRTKEVIKYVEVFKEKKEEKKKTKTVITETTKKDGTTEKKTEVTEDTDTTITTNKDTKVDTKKEVVAKTGSGITLAALAIKDANDFGRAMEYGATVTVPVFGNISVQGLATTDKRIGIGLGITF